MKFLIMSDSHGLEEEVATVINRHKQEVDYIIHCGDSELSNDHQVLANVYVVQGNCDWNGKFPEELIEQFGREKVFITHGHRYNVKSSYVPISYRAEEVGATIACFGHSHVAATFMENQIVYINPGSLKQPRGGHKEKTYVICEVQDEKNISVQFYDLNGNIVEALAKKFKRG